MDLQRGIGNRAPRTGRDVANPAERGGFTMSFNMVIVQPAVALIAGVLILAFPRLLNVLVAIYLIIVGVTGLMGH